MLAVWAETDLILADQFRDGNVPPMEKPLAVAKAAFAALPESVSERYSRGHSACHEHQLMAWLLDQDREDGPAGCIGFAISARMSAALRQAVEAVSEAEWQSYGKAVHHARQLILRLSTAVERLALWRQALCACSHCLAEVG